MAIKYTQGETYAEDDLDLDLDDEVIEDANEVKQIFGLPVKNFIIIIAMIFVVIVAVILILTRTKKNTDIVDEPLPVTDVSDIEVTPVADENPEYVSVWDDDLQQYVQKPYVPDSKSINEYSSAEQLELRSLGYTGDEIQYAIDNGLPIEQLRAEAQELLDQQSKESLKRMSDEASEEFQFLLKNTYLGQPEYPFVSHKDQYIGQYSYDTASYTVNADYVKCPEYGQQLYLKLRVAQDLYLFYSVTPERYDHLPVEGNIVVRIQYTVYGDNLYVTDISETDSTMDTIDSSTKSISEIAETTGDLKNKYNDKMGIDYEETE